MADTANLDELRELYSFFPLEGVTTNPTILNHSGHKLSKSIQGIQELVGTGKPSLSLSIIEEKRLESFLTECTIRVMFISMENILDFSPMAILDLNMI